MDSGITLGLIHLSTEHNLLLLLEDHLLNAIAKRRSSFKEKQEMRFFFKWGAQFITNGGGAARIYLFTNYYMPINYYSRNNSLDDLDNQVINFISDSINEWWFDNDFEWLWSSSDLPAYVFINLAHFHYDIIRKFPTLPEYVKVKLEWMIEHWTIAIIALIKSSRDKILLKTFTKNFFIKMFDEIRVLSY